ncbi:MAG TPA: peptidylprolyl isomerase [Vicinamibacterales bacterium]
MAAEDRRARLPPDLHTPALDALRLTLDEDGRRLVALAGSSDPRVQAAAIRALGRYESREFTATIAQYLANGPTGEVATALAQSLRGAPLTTDTAGEQVPRVLESLVKAGENSLYKSGPQRFVAIDAIARAIGRLPYTHVEELEAADSFLLLALRRADDDPQGRSYIAEITRALESRARLHAKLSPLGPAAIDALRGVVSSTRKYPPAARVNAMAALMVAGGVDAYVLQSALSADDPELKRLGFNVLGGSAAPIDPDERTRLLRVAMVSDRAYIVSVEALRAWVRTQVKANGCGPLIDVLRDGGERIRLLAIDALGDACRDDPNVTDRLTFELRSPPEDGGWERPAHALVAMAKRAPDRAAIAMPGYVAHPTWQVRMYAARAAAIMKDPGTLERLAYDPEPNVREATLVPLRTLKGNDAIPVFVAALGQRNYQLLHSAAVESKGMPATPALVVALCEALTRVTREKKETSRDARLALIERIGELADADQAATLRPLLQDFDVPVAMAAAATLERWTGKPQELDPQLLGRPAPPSLQEVERAEKETATVTMKSGAVLKINLDPDRAPLMSVRFLRLALAGYYNGLTIHRIVPNFVVQGGSPGANEYDGDALYVRDEISLLGNLRGTVGLSTRGRDTGDAQFYFNLVDNPRLDYEYTVFATVAPAALLDTIVEGDTISSITFAKPERERRSPASPRRPRD